MSQEELVYSFSYPSGQPPTPIRTPTSGTFGEDLLQTPKAESSFYDPRVTWNTADPYASSPTLLKTPQHLTLTSESRETSSTKPPKKRPLSSQDFDLESSSHVHCLSPTPSHSLSSLEASRHFSLSPNPESAKRNCVSEEGTTLPSGLGLELDTHSTMRSAGTMQTPPPTSTSASRRKAQQAQLTQQLTTNGGRVPSPGFPKRINPAPALEHSLFPDQSLIHDKFSPDDFSLELSGPVTAPLFPHEHMFWDPNRNDQMDIDFPSGSVTEYQTGPYADTDLALSSRAQARTATLERSQQAMYEDFASSAPTYNEYSKKTASGSEQTGFISAPRLVKKNPTQSKILGTAVDPSLLFSSPGRVSEFVQVPMSTTNTLQDDALQPYAYQIQEAKREGASQGVRKQKKKRKSDIDSPAVKAALQTLREEGINRPGLRRSATDSIVTKEDKVLSRDPKSTLARQITSEKIRRPSSPSKQQQNPAKRKSNYEHSGQRTAITLTIDDSGRARTETKIISDSSEKQLHDAKMTVCIESEGSETESSSDRSGSPIITSQPTSFTYGPHERLKLNRGLFVNDSRCHSQKSSYSSVRTSSSNNSGVTGPGNRGLRAASGLSSSITNTGRPNTSPSDMSVFHMPRTGGVTINPFHSGLGTVVDSQDSNGTAQHELEKVLKVRRQNRSIADAPSNQPRPTESSRHKAFLNHQAEQQPFDFTEAFPFDYDAAQNFYTDVSPTTITDPDLATPSTDYNQSVSSIRCVCHVPETDGHLISCESCKKRLHTRCVGINPHLMPKVYLCIFCTGHTPNVRGGRIREPATVGFLQPSSPLAHKSGQFR